jgi:hypothetical protein
VTDPRLSDVRLAEAFQALEDPSGADVPEDLRERIWQAVSGALPAEERREIVDRVASDPACAEAWRVAAAMWQASQSTAPVLRAVPPRTTRWAPAWLATAAVLLLGTAIGVVSLLNRPQVDEFRASPGVAIESRLAPDVSLPREAFRLRWSPGPEGARYQVRVTTEDLRVLATTADLTEAQFTVEPAALAGLASGSRVFWQVEVLLPDGGRVASPTFVTHVQ